MDGVLLAVLILEAIIIFLLNGKNILSPSIIVCAVFIFSSFVYLISEEYYGHEISFTTVSVIALMIFCIFIGEFIVNLTTRGKNYIRLKEQGKPLVLPVYACLMLEALVFLIGLVYFRSVYRYSLKVGNTAGNYFGMARFVRIDGNYSPSIFISQGKVISECLLYFFIYYLFYNKAAVGKFFFRYLWMIFAYVPHILAADNRTNLLRGIAISAIMIFFILKQSAMWGRKNDKKIIFWSVFAVALFLLLFRLLGYRTNFSGQDNAWDNLVKYISSGIVGLDKFLTGEISFTNVLFGERTFMYIYQLLRSWGFTSIPDISHFDVFFNYAQGHSNIYTGIKALVQDFNIFGASLFLVLAGMIITCLTNNTRYYKISFLRLFLFGWLFYPLIMLSIDGVFSTVIGITTIYFIFYIIVIQFCANIVRDKKYDRRDFYAFS